MGKNKLIALTLTKIKKSIRRFLALTILSFLGVLVFVGIKMSNPDMVESLDKYYDMQNVYDLKIISTLGLTDKDVSAISNLDDKLDVYGSHSKDMQFHVDNKSSVIKVIEINNNINKISIDEGRIPENGNEIVIESGIITKLGLKLGDKIYLDIAEDDTTINTKEVTLVGIVTSPVYVINSNGNINRGNTNLGTGSINYYGYTTPDFFNMDYYTEIYITAQNKLKTNSDEYKDFIEKLTNKINEIKESCEKARREEVLITANEEVNKKENEGLEQFSDIKEQLDNAENELENGRKKLERTELQLNESKIQLSDAREEIDEGYEEIQIGEEQLNQAKNDLDLLKKEIEKEISKYHLTYNDVCIIIDVVNGRKLTKNEVIDLIPQDIEYYDNIVDIVNYIYENKYEKAIINFINGISKEQLINLIPDDIENYDEVIKYIREIDTSKIRKKIISVFLNENYIEEIKANIPKNVDNYDNIIKALDDYEALAIKIKELYNGVEQLQNGFALYERNLNLLENSKKQLNSAEEQYQNGLNEYNNGIYEYNKGKRIYNDNLNLYNSKIEEYNLNFDKFNKEIQKAKNKINSLDSAKWYIYNRIDNSDYSSYIDSSESVERLAAIFPTIFFIVAIFISSLSMARMAIEDRMEIGTLKSLGYGNNSIRGIYVFYAGVATLIGGVLRFNCGIFYTSKSNF